MPEACALSFIQITKLSYDDTSAASYTFILSSPHRLFALVCVGKGRCGFYECDIVN